MQLLVRNKDEARQYATEVCQDFRDHKYRVVVSGRGTNPESAYEDVNNSTYLEIPSLSDIARKFGEDHKDLDVEKREYADELNKLCRAHGALQKNGMDFNVEISLSVEGETPGEAIESIEDAEVTPVMRREDDEYESTILYVENELSVNTIPQGSSTNKEALQRKKYLEELISSL